MSQNDVMWHCFAEVVDGSNWPEYTIELPYTDEGVDGYRGASALFFQSVIVSTSVPSLNHAVCHAATEFVRCILRALPHRMMLFGAVLQRFSTA